MKFTYVSDYSLRSYLVVAFVAMDAYAEAFGSRHEILTPNALTAIDLNIFEHLERLMSFKWFSAGYFMPRLMPLSGVAYYDFFQNISHGN